MVGGVVGLALIGFAAFLCLRRRRRQDPSSTSEKPFKIRGKYEPTEDVQVIMPFVGATNSDGTSTPERPGHHRHYTSTTDSADGYAPSTEKPQEPLTSYDDTFFGREASTTTGPTDATTDNNSRQSAAPVRRPTHAEDMEDADEASMLPPMYRESWGQRHVATDAEDAAVGVVRQEAPGGSTPRARDVLSPISTSKEGSSIVSDLKSGAPLVSASRDGYSPITPSRDGHSMVSTPKSALSPK